MAAAEPPTETKPKSKESNSKQNKINFEDLKGYNIDKCDLKATSSLKIIPSRVVNCTPRPFSGPSSFESSALSPLSTTPQPPPACPSPAFLQAPSPVPVQQASPTKEPAFAAGPAHHAVYETIEEPKIKPTANVPVGLKESSPVKEPEKTINFFSA